MIFEDIFNIFKKMIIIMTMPKCCFFDSNVTSLSYACNKRWTLIDLFRTFIYVKHYIGLWDEVLWIWQFNFSEVCGHSHPFLTILSVSHRFSYHSYWYLNKWLNSGSGIIRHRFQTWIEQIWTQLTVQISLPSTQELGEKFIVWHCLGLYNQSHSESAVI